MKSVTKTQLLFMLQNYEIAPTQFALRSVDQIEGNITKR